MSNRIFQWDRHRSCWDVDNIYHPSVFWTEGAAYILGYSPDPGAANFFTTDEQLVLLVSIGGDLKTRWTVTTYGPRQQPSDKAAIKHFMLKSTRG